MNDGPQIFHIADTAHRNAFELLPWYVNGTLSAAETASVAEHLKVCLRCQHELAQLSILNDVIGADDGALTLEPTMMRAHGLIDAYERDHGSNQRWGIFRSLWRRPTRTSAVLAMSLASVVVVALLLLKFDGSSNADFTTLANATSKSPAYELTIIFEAQATHESVRELLIDIQAEIVHGPSDEGGLVVAVPRSDADKVIAFLADSPIVSSFAVPERIPSR